MLNKFRLEKENTALLVIDIQERLAAAMPPVEYQRMLARSEIAVRAAQILGLPVVVTEQYPRGLGTTVSSLLGAIKEPRPVEKIRFSCVSEVVLSQLAGRKQVLIVGMEAHVCVFQTVRDLLELKLQPYVLADAIISRANENLRIGVDLCREAGAVITSTESAVFDLLVQAATPEFKTISSLLK